MRNSLFNLNMLCGLYDLIIFHILYRLVPLSASQINYSRLPGIFLYNLDLNNTNGNVPLKSLQIFVHGNHSSEYCGYIFDNKIIEMCMMLISTCTNPSISDYIASVLLKPLVRLYSDTILYYLWFIYWLYLTQSDNATLLISCYFLFIFGWC